MLHSSLFAAFSDADKKEFLGACPWIQVRRGERLIEMGESYGWGILLLEGFLRLETGDVPEQCSTASILKPGDAMMESITADTISSVYRITAITSASYYKIPCVWLRQFLWYRPALALLTLDVISQKIIKLRRQISRITMTTSLETIGRFLYELSVIDNQGRVLLDKRIPQKDLACMLSLSREEMNRKMKQLEQAGLAVKSQEGWFLSEVLATPYPTPLLPLEKRGQAAFNGVGAMSKSPPHMFSRPELPDITWP